MNIDELKNLTLSIIRRSERRVREMELDGPLFKAIRAEFGPVARQHWVFFHGSERPARIDFRLGGTNPVLIELAVRPKGGRSELYGSQNRSELFKLTRVPQSKAKLRALLLVDFADTPIPQPNLQTSYDVITSGPGNFERNPVRVVYVHEHDQYSFRWAG